jgi:hypothetical protein
MAAFRPMPVEAGVRLTVMITTDIRPDGLQMAFLYGSTEIPAG